MEVSYFRAQVKGPEAELETVLIPQLESIFRTHDNNYWAGAYISIGASRPDLILSDYHPYISALRDIPLPATELLGCLKLIPRASVPTITSFVGLKEMVVMDYLATLLISGIVVKHSNSYSLSNDWRNILPTVISIELKVNNWRKAVYQAITNRSFAHMNYIALPQRIAHRVKPEEVLSKYGIGLISISEDGIVDLIRRARRSNPKVWAYYFKLATILASDFEG